MIFAALFVAVLLAAAVAASIINTERENRKPWPTPRACGAPRASPAPPWCKQRPQPSSSREETERWAADMAAGQLATPYWYSPRCELDRVAQPAAAHAAADPPEPPQTLLGHPITYSDEGLPTGDVSFEAPSDCGCDCGGGACD